MIGRAFMDRSRSDREVRRNGRSACCNNLSQLRKLTTMRLGYNPGQGKIFPVAKLINSEV